MVRYSNGTAVLIRIVGRSIDAWYSEGGTFRSVCSFSDCAFQVSEELSSCMYVDGVFVSIFYRAPT